MKISAAIIFASMLTVFSAHADPAFIEVAGAFAAGACGSTSAGQSRIFSPVKAVCIGDVTAKLERVTRVAVEFQMNDGGRKVFEIARSENLFVALPAGKTKSVVYLIADDGAQAAMKVIKNSEGHIESAQGTVEGLPFFVKSFVAVVQPL